MDNSIAKKMTQMLGMMLLVLVVLLAGVASASAGKPTVEGDAAVTATPEVTDESTAAVTATAEAVANCTVRARIAGMEIHVGPGLGRIARGSVPYGVDISVVGQAQDKEGATWYNIHLADVTTELDRYWVSATDVDSSGDCTQVPEVPASPFIAAALTVSYPSQTAIVSQFGSGTRGYVLPLPGSVEGFISNDRAKDDSLNADSPTDFYTIDWVDDYNFLYDVFISSADPTNAKSCTLQLRAFGDGFSLSQYNLDLKGNNYGRETDSIIAGNYYFSVSIYPDDATCTFHYNLSFQSIPPT